MFSFFKKKKIEPSFKQNVAEFWEWFASNSARFKQTIDAGHCADLIDETSTAVNKLIPKIGWCYGPGKVEGSHSLTLSPEGDRDHQFLTAYWLECKTEIANWDFYPAKQGGDLNEGYSIETGGFSFGVNEIWISSEVEPEEGKIGITIWHHHFHEIDENAAIRVTFILLDELLGEYAVQNYIGSIDLNTEKLADSIPLIELPEYLEKIKNTQGWDKPDPCESYCTYELPGEKVEFPRSDAFIGSTCHFDLVRDYFIAKGKLADPLAGSNADYIFLRFSNSILPKGHEVDFRSNIEDKISDTLIANRSGRSFGGSQGSEYAYLDFIIYDGQNSIDLVLQEMKTAGLPGGSTLHYWASENKKVVTL